MGTEEAIGGAPLAATFSSGLAGLPGLEKFLGCPVVRLRSLGGLKKSGASAVAVWGSKQNPANRLGCLAAERLGLPLWRLEDGFLRSLDLGGGSGPLSLVVDKSGIYYDAEAPSDLENLLNSSGWESPELLARAEEARLAVIEADLSKYNYSPPAPPNLLGDGRRPRVLVLDQTFGDQSVRLGGGETVGGLSSSFPAEAFKPPLNCGGELPLRGIFPKMLAAALAENPAADIFIKTHPQVSAGRRRGYFKPGQTGRAVLIEGDYSPLSLLAQADEVYTVTSQMGFEALMLGKNVHCFGLPFYAGWGLTRDAQSCARRRARRSLNEIFAAAYLLYPRYFNPVSGELTDIFEIIRLLKIQRERALANRGFWAVTGFSLWKRPQARAYLGTPGAEVSFSRDYPAARRLAAERGGRVLVWASKFTAMSESAAPDGPPLVRMEDGFLRSVGLGSDFQAPSSLVLDEEGIYYDPTRPSGLENILNSHDFAARPDLVERARRLKLAIIEGKISKYNRVGRADFKLEPPPGRRVILVPGQVEDDASIRLGAPEIKRNLDLLREVRAKNPEAWIIYKPHPDVEAGNRQGAAPAAEAARWADLVLDKIDLACLWDGVQEVHTLTSLVGFEALLRNLPVHTYGLPFYAGWGLTHDRLACPRRTRRLSVDELAAGALILYPVYYDWFSGLFCGPEDILEVLGRAAAPTRGRKRSFVGHLGREALTAAANLQAAVSIRLSVKLHERKGGR